MAQIQELHEKRDALVKQMQELHTQHEDDWSDEHEQSWTRMSSEVDSLGEQIEEVQKRAERAARIDAYHAKVDEEESAGATEIGERRQERTSITEKTKAEAFKGWLLRTSGKPLGRDQENAIDRISAYRNSDFVGVRMPNAMRGHGMWSTGGGTGCLPSRVTEQRTLQVSSEPEIIPEGFMNNLSQAMLAYGGFRRVCRIVTTPTGNDVPWPTLDDTGNSGALLGEGGSIGSSVDPTISAVTLKAYRYSSTPILVSDELLGDSAFNLAEVFGELLGIRIGRATAAHFATGDNSSKPQGITVFASAGDTAAAVDAVTADELIDLQASLDPAWEMSDAVAWAMNKATVTSIRKLKDSDNQYLWQPGLQAGTPDLLLGKPVAVIQEMPSMSASTVPIVYGDMTQYVIRDAGFGSQGMVRFYTLTELYRANDLTGFIAFTRCDGRGLQSGAIKKMTMAAS